MIGLHTKRCLQSAGNMRRLTSRPHTHGIMNCVITDCNTATDSALKAAATMMIVNDDTGKTYQGAIKVIGGKPVFEYDEVVTG